MIAWKNAMPEHVHFDVPPMPPKARAARRSMTWSAKRTTRPECHAARDARVYGRPIISAMPSSPRGA